MPDPVMPGSYGDYEVGTPPVPKALPVPVAPKGESISELSLPKPIAPPVPGGGGSGSGLVEIEPLKAQSPIGEPVVVEPIEVEPPTLEPPIAKPAKIEPPVIDPVDIEWVEPLPATASEFSVQPTISQQAVFLKAQLDSLNGSWNQRDNDAVVETLEAARKNGTLAELNAEFVAEYNRSIPEHFSLSTYNRMERAYFGDEVSSYLRKFAEIYKQLFRSSDAKELLQELEKKDMLVEVSEAWQESRVFQGANRTFADVLRHCLSAEDAASISRKIPDIDLGVKEQRPAVVVSTEVDIPKIAKYLRAALEAGAQRYAPKEDGDAMTIIQSARESGQLVALENQFSAEYGRSITSFIRSDLINRRALTRAYYGKELAAEIERFAKIEENFVKSGDAKTFVQGLRDKKTLTRFCVAWNETKYQGSPSSSFLGRLKSYTNDAFVIETTRHIPYELRQTAADSIAAPGKDNLVLTVTHLHTALNADSAGYAPEEKARAVKIIALARKEGYLDELNTRFAKIHGKPITEYINEQILHDAYIKAYYGSTMLGFMEEFQDINDDWFKSGTTKKLLARIAKKSSVKEFQEAWDAVKYKGYHSSSFRGRLERYLGKADAAKY